MTRQDRPSVSPIEGSGWQHVRPKSCPRPEPRPFQELLSAGMCRHCGQPIRWIDR